MKIKFWGCRGSIPAPGAHTLKYGGNTTCVELRPPGGGVLIIDAGSGIRMLGKQILKEKTTTNIFLLFTHSHWDHLIGFPFFTPAYFKKYNISVYGGPNAQTSLRKYLTHQMTPPFFPVEFDVMKANFHFGNGGPNAGCLGGVGFASIELSHPNGGYGFKLSCGGKSFVFLTDNEPAFPHEGGLPRECYVDFCRGADLLVHDAQYTDEEYKVTRGWGHSTFPEATRIAVDAGVKRLGLFHHDPDRSDDELDILVDSCRHQIEQAGADIDCFACMEGAEIDLS
ncbi:MAG TPA: MBL fold metallo-hydrolase [Candidatus Ozemobacteraceae bacterium]|nr:MBL fold metallo-hydrolase [Candidatus Ozemobacteraceae bacterium]